MPLFLVHFTQNILCGILLIRQILYIFHNQFKIPADIMYYSTPFFQFLPSIHAKVFK